MQELEKTTDALYESRRQGEVVRTALETQKFEHDKFIGDLRSRHSVEITEMSEQNHSL